MPLAILIIVMLTVPVRAAELKVICTVPDLADLVTRIGGDRVSATALARASDNPHFISVRPSFIRQVASADAVILVGLELEIGWLPALLRSARNRNVQPGSPGLIDCSQAITPMEVPVGPIDRSQGDVHPSGNPHYLLSPRCGIQVIRFLGDRLAVLDAAGAAEYRQRAEELALTLARSLYGEPAVAAHALDDLLQWHADGSLQQRLGLLGGWLQRLAALREVALIGDHKQWPYLADCYGFELVGHLEPKAGVPPSSAHLQSIIQLVRDRQVRGLVTSPWFDRRAAGIVADAGGIPVLQLAHQVEALPDTSSYLALCATHVETLATLMASKP